jgi:hypothetical protein
MKMRCRAIGAIGAIEKRPSRERESTREAAAAQPSPIQLVAGTQQGPFIWVTVGIRLV